MKAMMLTEISPIERNKEDNRLEEINCAIDFTPVGETVREALKTLEKGGRIVVNAFRKVNPISELDYTEHLWQ